ncbi:TlpA family protein disulfide reductase [Paenibacillus sp. N1-5-1-14]|uniref:TlpA disulfide reductase family protein n=1 Tax=Paenibacillus radicibacter TaxID=2972488 RepID=UPI002158DBBB|nr:TlpA disulfide reductase family protein [Paenibacillus radicibacter]MCR8643900.1 TlpA family protein disulfide reductase [Paenibacillus radicibacter]
MKKNIAVLSILIMLVGIAVYQNIQTKQEQVSVAAEEMPKPDYRVPSFTLASLTGEEFKVGGERDKPLMINFWASWCGPCEKEAPDLVKLYQAYEGQFDLYAVNITQGDSMRNVRAFVDRHQFQFPVLLDKDGKISEKFRVIAIPTSFIVDKKGVIRDVFYSETYNSLNKKIKAVLDDK